MRLSDSFRKHLADCFDADHPSVERMRKAYRGRKAVDARDAETAEQMSEAVHYASRSNRPLILPDELPWGPYWDREAVVSVYSGDMQMRSELQFVKYAPQTDIVPYGTPARELVDSEITPGKAFLETFRDEKKRERMLHDAYNGTPHRGFGWWNPFNRTHVFVPFHVPAEGHWYKELLNKEDADREADVSFEAGDSIVWVPSVSRRRRHKIKFRFMPVTGGEFYKEWVRMDPRCGCEWVDYREMRSRRHVADDIELLSKYSNGEVGLCYHSWEGLEEAEDYIERRGRVKLQTRFMRPRENLVSDLRTLSMASVVMPHNGKARRPTKTEEMIIFGLMHATDDPADNYYIPGTQKNA